jgi:hypothetical protein
MTPTDLAAPQVFENHRSGAVSEPAVYVALNTGLH